MIAPTEATITTPEQMREAAARCCDEYYMIAPTELEAEILDAQLEFTADRIRAIPIAPQPVAVTVKPLVWVEEKITYPHAMGGRTRYQLGYSDEGWTVHIGIGRQKPIAGPFDNPEAAQVAAQVDYEARILSAIEASPARDVRAAALREAAAEAAGEIAAHGYSEFSAFLRHRILALIDKEASTDG